MPEATCPIGALTSFPLGIGFTPTTSIYNSLPRDTSRIQLMWGTRMTHPSFLRGPDNGGIIDEQTGMTTLRYNTNTYNLMSVQMCKSTHTPWVLPVSSQPSNKEDLMFIFNTNAVSTTPIIMIIVPIVRNGEAKTDPKYLTGLDVSGSSTGPYSMQDCVPLGDYVKYSTCLNGYSTEATTANALVFVDISGLAVSEARMTSIQKNGGFGATGFPAATAYFMNKFSTMTVSVTASTIMNQVSITSPFVNYVPPSNAPPTTDDYKCMPLDMTQIQASDLSGAKTLTQILLPELKDEKILDPGKLERGISIALGVIMGIMFFGLGIYMLWGLISGIRGSTASGPQPTVTVFSTIFALWPFLLVLIVGIACGAAITVVTSK